MLGTKVVLKSLSVRLLAVKVSSDMGGDERDADEVSHLRMSYSDLMNQFACKPGFFF